MAKLFMKGNEAVGEAAVRGGIRFFAGYPITPQSELPEYLSWRLPEVCGTFIQAESEVAAINMVYGAAATGARAMTGSSSPGISLKSEGISYLSAAELPAVIINVQRGGPGLGSIQPAQQDYLQATKAPGHGGFRMMVFAPNSIQEAVDLVYEAPEYADRDRSPVLVLMDGCLGTMMDEVELPPFKELPETICKPWTVGYDGTTRSGHLITPIYPEAGLEGKNKLAVARTKRWEENDVQVEEFMLDDAEWVIVAYGIASRVAKQAILNLRNKGVKVGMIRPITLFPFPKKSIAELDYSQVKGLIDIEMSIPALMREDIELQVLGRAPVYEYGRSGGVLLDDDSTEAAIWKIIEEASSNG
ncbi:MAG: 3-methyl-2-oxobutanoate dehydrogenase subunit VorB [Ruminococcaceae bacterium]|nr:3-methyl-2-oxobutanoate dehydrogenase subunit VorB [Oscillospiraceae bacterium]